MSLYIDIEKKLENFNLKVNLNQTNQILGLLGESGCGKSITLKCIAGLETPDKGIIKLNNKILFDSKNNINLKPQDRNTGFVFQNYALFPHMTVSENIKIGLDHIGKNKQNEICENYINKFNLNTIKNSYPNQLSGGQQQRVAIARALAKKPDILLLDEPFSALDYHLRDTMEENLRNILKEYKGDAVFVTHNIDEAYRVCEDIAIYDSGIAIKKRNKTDLFNNPKTLKEAKLTGFKNISRCRIINNELVYAIDWDLNVTVSSTYKNIEYIAIREIDIKISENINKDSHNMKIINIIENPFDYKLALKNSNNDNSCIIYIVVKKNEINLNNENYIKITFDKKNICLF
ncbi:MAG: sulfate/molybdate ABC transporter ATP-binding protein [Paraclostridium sp.]|uniref:sulfate/molybdate ABC transporter ATP-binding protein n=1 Tax=Paraclostridium sp. TaxID=2023273 RepID=UPI003F3A24E0